MNMTRAFASGLIDRIYEAAVVPDRWPDVLQEIADGVGARGALLNFMGDEVRFVPSPAVAALAAEYVAGGWTGNEARLTQLYGESHAGFLAETHYRTVEQLDALPIFRDFLKPRGFNGACVTAIQGVGDTAMHIAVEFASHAQAERAVDMLDPLRADLARALSLSAKIEAARVTAIVDGLAVIDAAAAIVRREGKLRAANDRFAARMGNRMVETRGGLRFADRFLQARFVEALARHSADAGSVQSIAIRDVDGAPPFAMHILPIRHAARAMCDADGVLLLIAEGANASVPNADLLRLLFDLTPAEAALTRRLLEGRTLTDASRVGGIAGNTARAHLRAVFAKTGTTRQADLLRLLDGLGAPQARAEP